MFQLPDFSQLLMSYSFKSLVLLFLVIPSFAAPQIQTPTIDSQLPQPIDTLQQKIAKTYRSKQAKTIKEAHGALVTEKFATAILLSGKVQQDEVFSDYGYWISASSYRGKAQKQIETKAYGSALRSAEQSVALQLKIEAKSPYSPFIRFIAKDIAQAELLQGNAYWGLKKWKNAEQSFERAFQRLQTQNLMILTNSDHLSHYAESCKHKPGPLCQSWLSKLAGQFSKKPDDLKVIEQYFPSALEKIKPGFSGGKSTIPYKGPDLDVQAFDAGMKLYFSEKFSQASKSFSQFLDDFPRSTYRFRVRYWLGQALSHEQEHEKAQKIYAQLQAESPLTYYGYLASNASGKSIETSLDATLPLASETDPALSPQETLHLKRANHFVAEKAFDLAAYELKDLRARDALSSPFLVYLAMLNYSSRNYNNSFQLIGELIQRGYEGILSSYGLRMIFPVEYLNTIKKYSTVYSLDPILVLSLIKQESAFDEDVNSPVGAMGLMQLMPGTATDMDPKVNLVDLLRAEDNVRIGAKYLKKLLNRFNGNIVFALAGYNAGPNAVDRWIKDSPQKRGMLEFIESIPYKETREYVGAIIRNYYWYSRQLNGLAQKDLNYFWNVYGPPETPQNIPSELPAKPQNGSA